MSPKLLEKISRFISEISSVNGKIRKIEISNVSKQEAIKAGKTLGFKCYPAKLGFFAFMITYIPEDSDSPRYFMGLPADCKG